MTERCVAMCKCEICGARVYTFKVNKNPAKVSGVRRLCQKCKAQVLNDWRLKLGGVSNGI